MEPSETEVLLQTLQTRFEQNPIRHPGISWAAVRARLDARRERLDALAGMELTGGEPDVVGQDPATGEVVFCDCSPETPAGRRSLCYDEKALWARKENKPAGSALGLAQTLGIEVLTEEDYRDLQTRGEFDKKTSSWLKTPAAIRDRGGALFGDRRYDHVFVYHNGADSYYAVRGFRGRLAV
jgi:hypothetical protein